MDGRQGSKEKLERGRRLGRGVWVLYLTTGAVLAVSRMALLVWMNYRHPLGPWDLLYPEAALSIPFRGLAEFGTARTEYYLAWGSLVTLGSFVMATPILLVGWLLRRRRRTVEADRTEPRREPMPPPPSRPRVVTVAVLLYYAGCIGFVFGVTHADSRTVLLTGLFMAFIVVTVHFCAIGHSWARILLAINGAISLLMCEGIVFEVAAAAREGRSIGLARGLNQAITPAMYAVTVVASSLLLVARASAWSRGGRRHTAAGSSPRTITWITLAVLLSLPAVGGFRYREWTRHALPADVVVEIRKQLAEFRSKKAALEDLVAKLETDPGLVATLPPLPRSPGVASDSTAGGYIESLEIRIATLRSGDTIYRDVRTRWPQLSVRQRFEVASMIGNALGINAEYYAFFYGSSDERRGPLEGRGLFEHPAHDVRDTSQNLPDPR